MIKGLAPRGKAMPASPRTSDDVSKSTMLMRQPIQARVTCLPKNWEPRTGGGRKGEGLVV